MRSYPTDEQGKPSMGCLKAAKMWSVMQPFDRPQNATSAEPVNFGNTRVI